MRRSAAVAGSFYPARPELLAREVERAIEGDRPRRPVVGCVVPHAGLQYSGHVAGAVYSRVELTPTVVLLGPNHYGRGAPLALYPKGSWETPLGDVAVDEQVAAALLAAFPVLEEDAGAHRVEHSLEVQLPFLRYLAPQLRIVPILLSVGDYATLEELGRVVAAVVKAQHPRPLVLASSDFNHYESDSVTRVKDRKAIEAILALDPRRLYDTIRRERISMCGYEPTIALLTAAHELGVANAELIRHATSAEVSGDYNRVVGYAGIVLW